MDIKEVLVLCFKVFLIKNLQVVVVLNLCQINNLHINFINQLLKKNLKKVYSSFRDNIWVADLADMQLISKFDKGIRFLLCVIDICSKYAWVVPLKDKRGVTIVSAFQNILNSSMKLHSESKTKYG